MAEAKRDQNRVPTIIGVSSSDDITPVAVATDPTTKRMRVDAIQEEYGHSAVSDGTKAVTTAGTRVQLSDTSVACKRVYIEANSANIGIIVIGGATVVAAEATRRGLSLYATQGEFFKVNNLNLLYLDATNSGDKINYYMEV